MYNKINVKIFTIDQHHFAIGKLADADLGALQVGHDGHHPASTVGRLAHQCGTVNMVLRHAVAEVQAHHIHACSDHVFKQDRVA